MYNIVRKYISLNLELWSLYKFILFSDLFGAIEVFNKQIQQVNQIVNRFYRPLHATNDTPNQLIKYLLKQQLYGSEISQVLQNLIGLHFEIKEESITLLNLEYDKVLEKYRRIKRMQIRIRTEIFKTNLKKNIANVYLNNYENQFLRMYFQSTKQFKLVMKNIDLIFDLQNSKNFFPNINSDNSPKRIHQNPFQNFRQSLIENGIAYTELKKLSQILENMQFSKYTEFIELLDLLKLNVIKYCFTKTKIRGIHKKILYLFSKINIFKTQTIINLWKRFNMKIKILLDLFTIKENKQNKQNKENIELEFTYNQLAFIQDKKYSTIFSATQENIQRIEKTMKQLHQIFAESDLLLVSNICNNWTNNTTISDSNKILLVGRTKAGKTALINFLSGRKQEQENQLSMTSQTFFPSRNDIKTEFQIKEVKEKRQVSIDLEIWDLPGLQDTRQRIFGLCTGFFIRKLSQNSKIKINYLISNYDSFIQNLDNYFDVIQLLGEILNWEQKNLDSVHFIFSKVQLGDDLGIVKARKRFQKQYQKIQKLQDKDTIIQKLIVKGHKKDQIIRFDEKFRKKMKECEFFYQNDIGKMQFEQIQQQELEMSEQQDQQQFQLRKKKKIEQRLKKKEQFNKKSESRKQQNRKKILTKLYQKGDYIKLNQRFSEFIKKQNNFIQNFEIEEKLKIYIADINKMANSNQLLIKLYKTIKLFKEIKVVKLKNLYDQLFKQFQNQFEHNKANFYNLNKINLKKSSNSQIKEQFKKIIVPNLSIFFQIQNYSKVNGDVLEILFEYITQLCIGMLLNTDLVTLNRSVSKDYIILLQNQLKENKFKYPEIFSSNLKKQSKINKLYGFINQIEIQYNTVKIIQTMTKNNRNLEEILVMLEHLLVLRARKNYDKIINLNKKYIELDILTNLNNNQILRLNTYGEGIFNHPISLKDFLIVNALEQGEGIYRKYILTNSKMIKIFCNQLIFDLYDIVIEVNQGISIIAKRFTFPKGKSTLNIKTINQTSASVIIHTFQQYDYSNLFIHLDYYYEKIELNIQNENEINKQTIGKIKQLSKITSRTSFSLDIQKKNNGEYIQKLIYEPPICYLQKSLIDKKNITIMHKIISTTEQLEFGSLHLEYMIKWKLKKMKKFDMKNEKLCEKIKIISEKIITFIIDKFKYTSIRLEQRNFTNEYCEKISPVIINFLLHDQISQQKQDNLKKKCYKIIKQQLFKILFIKIGMKIEIQYQELYGKIIGYRKYQDQIKSIKAFCLSLLTEPYNRFQTNNKSSLDLNRWSKSINLELNQCMMNIIHNNIQISRIFTSLYLKIFDYFAQKGKEIIGKPLLQSILSERKYKLIRQYQQYFGEVSSFEKSRQSEQSTLKHLNKIRQNIFDLYEKNEFSALVQLIQDSDNQEFVKNDEISHIYIAQSYLKLTQFNRAREELLYIPYEIYNTEYITFQKLFNVLKKKYSSIYKRSIRKSQQKNQTITKDFEQQTCKYLICKLTKQQLCQSEVIYQNKKTSQNFICDILSFDSSQYMNGIINVIFAAEIQKHTHRPINHIFDKIYGQFNSSLIASALCIPKNKDSNSFIPQFYAYEFIPEYNTVLDTFDEFLNIKRKYKQLEFKNLSKSLTFFAGSQSKVINCYSTQNYYNILQNNKKLVKKNIFTLVKQAIWSDCKKQDCNPLLRLKTQFPDHFKTNYRIVSLGTATLFSNQMKQNKIIEQFNSNHINRWQIFLDNSIDMQKQNLQFYIDQARIFIQQKWIKDTKQMRDLMDRLEDKIILQYQ